MIAVPDDIHPGGVEPQWVKYVRWDVITRWRRKRATVGGEPAWPYAFASRDAAFPRIRGGVLWLVASPRYGVYRMPPTLVARLHITDVIGRDDPAAAAVHPDVRRRGRWIALSARDEGAYLPLNYSLTVLRRLRFAGRPDRLPDVAPDSMFGPCAHLPAHLQRHRVLTPGSAQLLDEYAAAVRRGRRVFLSYSWADFTEDRDWIQALADTLDARTVSCWWDRWHLPDPDDNPDVDGLLGDILEDAVHQAVWFVALVRSRYAAGLTEPPGHHRWAAWEWRQAGDEADRHRRHDLRRVALVLGDVPSVGEAFGADDLVLPIRADTSPQAAADLLLGLLPD